MMMEQVTPSAKNPGYRIVVLTALALLAFAGNSVLCRLALKGDLIGAGFFTAVRITTGAVALWVFVSLRGSGLAATRSGGSLQASAFLAVYMVAFSFAYLELSTGTGALLLFGAVQVTMIGWAITQGDRPNAGQWMGLIVALGGLAWLLAPGAEAPSLGAGASMALAGAAWGGYTLCGKGSLDSLRSTAGNFAMAIPAGLIVAGLGWQSENWTTHGLILAVVSGVVTSAAGYAIWYEALRTLTSAQAASLQLLVPVLAALGGLIFGAEPLGLRLVFASVLVLGGVGMVLRGKKPVDKAA